MAAPQLFRIAGKFGYVVVANRFGDELADVPFTSWSARLTRTFEDVTTSHCFSPDDYLTYTASIPLTLSMTVDVAGRFHRCNTDRNVIDAMYSARYPFETHLGFTPRDPYVVFDAFAEGLEMRVDAEGIVNFTCTLRSFGVVGDASTQGCSGGLPFDGYGDVLEENADGGESFIGDPYYPPSRYPSLGRP